MKNVHAERPRVALNAQLLRLNEGYRSAGIARYIFHLLRALAPMADDFLLDVFATEPHAPALIPGAHFRTTRLPAHKPLARIFWEQTVLPFQLRNNYTLLHSLAYVSPFFNSTPSIVTIYDLSFYLYPQYLRSLQRIYLQVSTRVSARRAKKIITISESSRRDLIQHLRVPPEKIKVIHPGVEAFFFDAPAPETLQHFRRTNKLPEHFILYVGTHEPRKNIPTLLRAFHQTKRALRLPHHLVLAGGRGWMDNAIAETIRELDIADQIIFPGFVPHAELPLWYRAADAFVYPSQYEGFGMPALEALACGTPTITSNVSSLPEAVGDAALLVDPRSTEQLAAALTRLLNDAALRHELAQRGTQHARQFTWTRAAQLTLETYRRALDLPAHQVAMTPAAF